MDKLRKIYYILAWVILIMGAATLICLFSKNRETAIVLASLNAIVYISFHYVAKKIIKSETE